MSQPKSLAPLKAAFTRFREALVLRKDELHRDGAIQRFEYTFELAWKALRAALGERGIIANSPREVLRHAGREGLVDDVRSWLDFLEKRNLSTHVYREEYALSIEGVFEAFEAATGKLIAKLEADA